MKTIQLGQGDRETLVDDEDYEWLSQWKWSYGGGGYVCRASEPRVKMHAMLIERVPGMQIDHKNRNPLDNRRQNLRIVTRAQNRRNSGPSSNNTSGYKGVTWHKLNRRWAAQTGVNGKLIHIGYFDTPEEAAEAYRAFCAPLEAAP